MQEVDQVEEKTTDTKKTKESMTISEDTKALVKQALLSHRQRTGQFQTILVNSTILPNFVNFLWIFFPMEMYIGCVLYQDFYSIHMVHFCKTLYMCCGGKNVDRNVHWMCTTSEFLCHSVFCKTL
jgi:hypothetical protein